MTSLPEALAVDDPIIHATEAGLQIVDDETPGIGRRRRGRGFSYHLPDGTLIDGADRDRLQSLAVPPAWSGVWYAIPADAYLLATGRDDADRKQYRYHDDFRAHREAWKFRRLAWFGPALDRIRRQVPVDLVCDDDHVRTMAAAVRLIDLSLIRVGSRRATDDTGARGATTLTGDDVEVHGDRIHLDFVAKGGLLREIDVVDPALAAVFTDLLDAAPDHATELFDMGLDEDFQGVRSGHVNAYLARIANGPYTAKDFRTWGGTVIAAQTLLAGPEGDRPDLEAIDAAAERLGNTRSVARGSYVAPAILSAHEDGSLADVHARTRQGSRLSRVERTVMRVLQAEADKVLTG